MKVNFLSNSIPWFGKYSGYECLPNYLPMDANYNIETNENYLWHKIVGKTIKSAKKWKTSSSWAYTETKFLLNARLHSISHILYLENHIHLFSKNNKRGKFFGTIHQPFDQWESQSLEKLAGVDQLIILYDDEREKFTQYIDIQALNFIRHGVDLNFFKPGDESASNKNRILFVGHYLRDFNMYLKAYKRIQNEISEFLEFHFVIPQFHRNKGEIQELINKSNVFFHDRISDEEMLKLYQTSYLMFMPMKDSGANTAIVQAIAAGLPIVTNDVGGIRSYGGETIFPISGRNDVSGLVEIFNRYCEDVDFRNKISRDLRNFAVEKLDWDKIAQKHWNLYEKYC